MSLTGIRPDDVSFLVYQDERRPCPYAVSLPDGHIAIDNHRVFQFIPQDGLPDVFRLPFVRKLCGVHPDDGQFCRILCLQFFEVGDDVHAIDTAIRPEVEQYHLSLKVIEGQGS